MRRVLGFPRGGKVVRPHASRKYTHHTRSMKGQTVSSRSIRWFGLALSTIAIASLAALGMTGCSPKATASEEPSETATQTPPPPSGPAAELAEPGEKLDRVTVPPEMMISRMRFQAERKGTSYELTFQTYGYGPKTAGRPSVVVKAGATAPKQTDQGRLAIDRKNCLLLLDKGVVVDAGGSYRGVVTLLEQGDNMYFLLTEASPE